VEGTYLEVELVLAMSIFVGIASYRDPECQWTVRDLFDKAHDPDNIFVGICWQFDTENREDSDCFVCETRPEQVRVSSMHWRDAKGPCPARHIMQSLWKGEEYYLQLDSHMRFVKDWDIKLLKFLSNTGNPRAIITSYPVGYQRPNLVPSYKNPAFLVGKGFSENDGMWRIEGKLLNKFSDKEPVKGCFWVSGFAFSKADIIKEVPYDPHLKHLFFGEEMLMGARLWTHGWDFYCPGENIIYHLWDRSYRKTFREIEDPTRPELEAQSKVRVWQILGMPNLPGLTEKIQPNNTDIDKYGLGTVRSLSEYEEYCGVDFANRKFSQKGNFGGLDQDKFMPLMMEFVFKQTPLVNLDADKT